MSGLPGVLLCEVVLCWHLSQLTHSMIRLWQCRRRFGRSTHDGRYMIPSCGAGNIVGIGSLVHDTVGSQYKTGPLCCCGARMGVWLCEYKTAPILNAP